MALPNDFDETLEQIIDNGILEETPEQINYRLQLALQGAAARANAAESSLGAFDWLPQLMSRLKTAVHNEICDAKKHALNDKYQTLLSAGLTNEGIASVAAVLTPIIAATGATFCVSAVVIYLSIFVLKIGLNTWCSYAPNAVA
jgi:hypothetical protein